MTSGGQLDDSLASMSIELFDDTKEVRGGLDPQQPLLSAYIRYTQVVASGLSDYFTFLDEDSEPDDPAHPRDYMVQEMTQLLHIRRWLIGDLRNFFTDGQIRLALSQAQVPEESEIINVCIDELNSVRTAVKITLRNAVWAALDDFSSEHVLAALRQATRTAALEALQSVAQKWDTFSKQLSSAKEIAKEQDSA
jgi:hypothetical protein